MYWIHQANVEYSIILRRNNYTYLFTHYNIKAFYGHLNLSGQHNSYGQRERAKTSLTCL